MLLCLFWRHVTAHFISSDLHKSLQKIFFILFRYDNRYPSLFFFFVCIQFYLIIFDYTHSLLISIICVCVFKNNLSHVCIYNAGFELMLI